MGRKTIMDNIEYSMIELLKLAANNNASDIQITVGVPPVMKVRGEWVYAGEKILKQADTKRLIRELFPNDETFNSFLAAGDKDFSLSIGKLGRFRMNTFIQRGSLAAAIRLV